MSLFRSKLFLSVSMVLAMGFSVLFVRAFRQTRKIERDIAQVERAIAGTEQKNREIDYLMEYFSKPEHLEKDARVRLNLKKAGEGALILSAPMPPAVFSATSAEVRDTSRMSFGPVADWLWSLFSRHE